MKKAVAYYRVSTGKQKRSGLGLEAQKAAISNHCLINGYVLSLEIEEVKSTRKIRPKLQEAFSYCKAHKATLIVATLDRLGRDVEEIAHNVKLPVEIIVVDNPHANRFTIHILAAVAEEQRRTISENTKKALAAAKSRGITLGENGKALARINKMASRKFAEQLNPIINEIRMGGFQTIQSITDQLNVRSVPTFRPGCKWHKSTVHKIMKAL